MAEDIPSSKRRKIEETVLNILKDADLETATESSVRTTASQQLCADLSDLASKTFIRQVVESFLLSKAPSTTTPDHAGNNKVSVPEETKAPSTTTPDHAGNKKVSVPEETNLGVVGKKDPEFGRFICELSNKRKVAILYLENGKPLVSIRAYCEQDGKQFPSNRGINLTGRQWGCFRSNISSIERAIARMESKIMRSAAVKDVALQGSKAAVAQNRMGTDIQDPINYVGTQSDTMGKGKHEILLGSSVDLPTTSSSVHQIAVGGLQGSTAAVAQNQMGTGIQDPINYVGTQSDTMEKGKHEILLGSSVDLPASSNSVHQIAVGGLQGSTVAVAQNQMGTDIQDPINYVGTQSDTMEKGKHEILLGSSVDLPTTSSSAHQIAVGGLQGSTVAVAQNQMGTDIQDPINYVGTQSDTMEKGKHEILLGSSVDLPATSSSVHQIAVGGLQGSTAAVAQNKLETDIQDPINYVGTQSDTMEKGKHEILLGSSVDLPTTSSSAHQIVVGGLESPVDTCPSRQGWHLPNNQLASSMQSLIPIMTTRFNGKNYHCWRHQMEFFLKQLNVAYVLTDSCPSTTSLEENAQAEVAAKKWANDEYICKHNIVNSLSDDLFQQYSKKKSYSAKELWEELKSDYSEEFGTVRSEVNKYIHFEMVDGISVVQQVEELNDMANSITKSGIGIDENFQASVIISKLPPSWKEYRAKLMHYEFLSVNRLLDLLKLEEESRNQPQERKSF